MMNVSTHFTKYGPKGVPKGFVETQKFVKGNTPCLEVEVSIFLHQPKDHQLTFQSHGSFVQSQSTQPKGFQKHSEERGS